MAVNQHCLVMKTGPDSCPARPYPCLYVPLHYLRDPRAERAIRVVVVISVQKSEPYLCFVCLFVIHPRDAFVIVARAMREEPAQNHAKNSGKRGGARKRV